MTEDTYTIDPMRVYTCGTCGRSWDDSIVTGMTPAPAARCPFEYYHDGSEVPDDFPVRPITNGGDDSPTNADDDSPVGVVNELNAYQLANMADCASPDGRDTAGAVFLLRVRDVVVEEWGNCDGEWDDDDGYHEVADDAPSIYTATRWAEFVDLAAYREDPDLGEWPGDLTDAAGIALYQIANRLAIALVEELRDLTDNLEDDDDTDHDDDIPARLEYLRGEIRAERISYGEIAELQGLAGHIGADDAELRQWAGIPEHDDTDTDPDDGEE